MSMAAVDRDWVGRVIDGRYALREWLGGFGGSGLFLTELEGPASRKAVIRLTPSAGGRRLPGTDLSHPHLAAILASGRAEVEGGHVEYVVTEYAEEVLSQILPERALTAEETREMLAPVLDALAYLHGKDLVHGHLKPSHILVIGESLKLSSDQLEVAGTARQRAPEPAIHDAPECGSGAASPAEDIWSLGITMVEALTQHAPLWERAQGGCPVVPESVPSPFAEIARRCLEPDPAQRCTLDEIRSLLDGKTVTHTPTAPEIKVAPRPPMRAKRRMMPLVAILAVMIAIIVALQMRSCGAPSTTQNVQPQQSSTGNAEPQAPAATQPALGKGTVAQRVMPNVSDAAMHTIHGTVRVTIRASVDENGAVSSAEFQSAGPSKYFARAAMQAARSWRFKPANLNGKRVSSVWMLRFDFRRDGVEAAATEQTP